MSDANRTINDFIQAWNALDIDAVMDFFTEDAEYANVPMGPPHVGKAAIREFIDGFMAMTTSIDFLVHHQVASSAGIVMNERTDRLVMNDNPVEVRVMGVFEVQDGKIVAWRDYFDMGDFS
ncbi:MAG: limonene-1,2-epoxide hydrolase family protein [Pseudomonadota bacterium]